MKNCKLLLPDEQNTLLKRLNFQQDTSNHIQSIVGRPTFMLGRQGHLDEQIILQILTYKPTQHCTGQNKQ